MEATQHKLVQRNVPLFRTTIYADATNAAGGITVNGLLQLCETKTGVRTAYLYDALGRRLRTESAGGSRSVATVVHYNDKG